MGMFRNTLLLAQQGNENAMEKLLKRYDPLLKKCSILAHMGTIYANIPTDCWAQFCIVSQRMHIIDYEIESVTTTPEPKVNTQTDNLAKRTRTEAENG